MMRAALAILMVSTAVPAWAQGGPDGLSVEGDFALGATDRVPGADAFLVGSGTVRLSFGRLGAELGVYGRADALDTPHETYGTVTLDIGASGRLSVGVPRPAYDGFAVSALEAAFPSLSIDRVQATRSAATFGAMFANWLPYGARFQNQSGALRYAVSVHAASTPGETVASLGFGTEIGDWQVSAAVEASDSAVSAKGQIQRELGAVSGGLGFYAPGAAGVSDLVEAFATFSATDRVDLTGVVQVPVDGGAATGGFSARYSLSPSTSVSLGVASDAGADPVYNAFVGFKF